MIPPILRTARLVLRPFTPEDAPAVEHSVSHWEVARETAAIPHPYPEGGAAVWIATHAALHEGDRALMLAVTRADTGEVIGAVDLRLNFVEERGVLGYWMAPASWGQGFATEAARELVRYGFEELGLHRIHADCLTRNPGSAAVLRKVGMRHEATQRRHSWRFGELADVDSYGILRAEWEEGLRGEG